MVSTSYGVECKVEDILLELMQDANTAAKQKGLHEACAKASGNILNVVHRPGLQNECLTIMLKDTVS